MKKNYRTPDLEVISLLHQDVLAASTYVPEPEKPTRAGEDNPIDDPFA